MADDMPLLPPIGVIHERLTRNERERRLLRALQRLALRAREDFPPRQAAHEPRQEAVGRGVER